MQPLTRTITVTGTLAAEDQVSLAFKVAGRVGQVHVDLGSLVTQRQIVATLVPTIRAAGQQARGRIDAGARAPRPLTGRRCDSVDADNTALVRQRRAVRRRKRGSIAIA
jgi:multidrug efflux pump subunit AcrA (membrane-fusion protein)